MANGKPSRWADMGKWAEAHTEEWLKAKSAETKLFNWHRFPDARAARGALAAQPSDWITAYAGVHVWLECKETAEKYRLPRAKVSQYSKLLAWHWAKAQVRVLVYRSQYQDWVFFDNKELFDHVETPTSFSWSGKPYFPTAASALDYIYKDTI